MVLFKDLQTTHGILKGLLHMLMTKSLFQLYKVNLKSLWWVRWPTSWEC